MCYIDESKSNSPKKIEKKPQLLLDTVWFFCSTKKSKDYHSNFNSFNFHHWWKLQLIPSLKKFENQHFFIILDNAKCYCSYGSNKKMSLRSDTLTELKR